MTAKPKIKRRKPPGGGWPSAGAVGEILARERVSPKTIKDLLTRHNKPHGYACVSCALAKPAHPHPLEFCESGAKATAWEVTSKRIKPRFFARHTISELETWPDHDLEEAGRLTHPMRWDPQSNKYSSVAWKCGVEEIGA